MEHRQVHECEFNDLVMSRNLGDGNQFHLDRVANGQGDDVNDVYIPLAPCHGT